MLVSIKWLEELLGVDLEINNLKKVSLSLGLEIEDAHNFAPAGIVIGKIEKITLHPHLKNLAILEIRTDKKRQIVSVAQNIKEGDFVLVGLPGAKLKSETIGERDFSGIKSFGVLVSEEELGMVEKSTGVIVLKDGVCGKEFKKYFDDLVVDIKTFPNRPDWLSMIGVARELAVGLGIRFKQNDKIKQTNEAGNMPIKIENLKGCPRYTARVFEDVEVQESAFWLKWRLYCMGMKGINNIVDITNYMMLLYGQPLHPFDLDLIQGDVIIRNAAPGQGFITLEGTTLKLGGEDLIIADSAGPIALAGIIGSRRAQISGSTRRILLESAYFEPRRIAHTARHFGLKTEASIRFEKGVDMLMIDEVSRLTGELFKKDGQAKELELISIGKKAQPKFLKFSLSRLNMRLSLTLNKARIKTMLKKVNIQVTGKAMLSAKIPHYRQDLQIEEDIYEEVARLFGYMNIPEIPTQRWLDYAITEKKRRYEEVVKNYLIGQGFNETYNLSLVASKRLIDLGYDEFVKIKNPLNERYDALRSTLFLGLLDCVNYNRSKGNNHLKLFEIGNILLPQSPFEEKRLGVIMGGDFEPDFWDGKNAKLKYFDAKGTLEAIFELLHIREIEFLPDKRQEFSQVVKIIFSGTELGYLGSVAKGLCEGEYFYYELSLNKMWNFVNESFYIPPAKFPANTRDLSFLVEHGTEVPQVINLIRKVGGPILERVTLFDYYQGDNLPRGKKNFGFRLYFRAPDRTLTDKEVEIFVKKIVDEIIKKFNASLRTKEKIWMN